MQVLRKEECAASVEHSTSLCTLGPSFNLEQNPCSLNDGSALAYFINSTWVQVGISSLPSYCDSTVAGIFTRVDQYINWISAVTGINQ